MEYKIRFKPNIQKKLDRLPKVDYYRVLAVLSIIAQNPYAGKKLKGVRADQWSMRVWPYRVIYMIHKKELVIFVVDVGHRQGIY